MLSARCHQAERSLFLQPLAEALRAAVLVLPARQLLAAAGDHAGALAELVPELRQLAGLPPYERGPPSSSGAAPSRRSPPSCAAWPAPAARAALDRLATALPADLRPSFLTRGRLAVRLRG